MNKMLLAAAGAAVFAISAPANAATTVAVTNSPFTAPGQGGGYAAFSGGIFGYTDGVYNFTFSLTTSLKTYVQMQITGGQTVPYSLFKVGNPVALVDAITPDKFTTILSAGDYYLSTSLAPPAGPASPSNFDTISGAIATSAVPEPATWAMLIAGLFGVGAFMRRQRRTLAMASAA
jgi:hypothetical protein